MEFNIGDRVRVCDYNDLPAHMKNHGMARICGCDGEIVDKLWSGAKGCTVYRVLFDCAKSTSSVDFPGETLNLISELDKKNYQYEFDYCDNVVVAILYEVGDDYKTEVARGHGHIIHEGVEGIAQASSYALKMIYYKLSKQNI